MADQVTHSQDEGEGAAAKDPTVTEEEVGTEKAGQGPADGWSEGWRQTQNRQVDGKEQEEDEFNGVRPVRLHGKADKDNVGHAQDADDEKGLTVGQVGKAEGSADGPEHEEGYGGPGDNRPPERLAGEGPGGQQDGPEGPQEWQDLAFKGRVNGKAGGAGNMAADLTEKEAGQKKHTSEDHNGKGPGPWNR